MTIHIVLYDECVCTGIRVGRHTLFSSVAHDTTNSTITCFSCHVVETTAAAAAAYALLHCFRFFIFVYTVIVCRAYLSTARLVGWLVEFFFFFCSIGSGHLLTG